MGGVPVALDSMLLIMPSNRPHGGGMIRANWAAISELSWDMRAGEIRYTIEYGNWERANLETAQWNVWGAFETEELDVVLRDESASTEVLDVDGTPTIVDVPATTDYSDFVSGFTLGSSDEGQSMARTVWASWEQVLADGPIYTGTVWLIAELV